MSEKMLVTQALDERALLVDRHMLKTWYLFGEVDDRWVFLYI